MGFRHAHINGLLAHARENAAVEIVAACEEDDDARAEVLASKRAEITHTSYAAMLEEVECDAIAVGDYYAKRGAVIIEALRRGKHVVADKPICTELEELDTIARLCEENCLKLGCMFDLRHVARFRKARELVRAGAIGEVHGVLFNGMHPLTPAVRPAWYFEPGKHGGTINDIAIHALDMLPWITGVPLARVRAARCWNAFAEQYHHFEDAAQVMLVMANNAGVLGDVSYFSPDSMGYSPSWYWRFELFGRNGVLTTENRLAEVKLAINGQKKVQLLPVGEKPDRTCLTDFLDDINGSSPEDALRTGEVIAASRAALLAQKAGDENLFDVAIP